jgi:hypothetical protein
MMFYARNSKILGEAVPDATNGNPKFKHYFQLKDTIEKQSRSGKATANAAITYSSLSPDTLNNFWSIPILLRLLR